MQGYKTFASKSSFEFPARITAIVGPNGAGKSNIADLLRWVLGEQTYSLLRGKKTVDMIFAGSDQRSRASMASSTLTFNNSNGWLPIDFEEVTIARRAYRDGQNEYLLNGQRVRLKEISELLAKAGLAERTYTIIGQGLVDTALSLKPEERRRFFEEAAGIGLYRSRREELINRLDKTRRNLERVQDILGELQPRLRSLERQAQKAMEYEQIQSDLRVLLSEWYGYHWHHTQYELAHSREVLKAQQANLSKSRLALEEANEHLEKQRSQTQGTRNNLNQWHGQSSELHRKRETVSKSLAVLEERGRALVEQETNLDRDLMRIKEEQKSHTERIQLLLDEIGKIESDLVEAEEKYIFFKQQLQSRRTERENIERNLEQKKNNLIRSETSKVQASSRIADLENQIKNINLNVKNVNEKISSEEQKKSDLQKKLDDINSQLSDLEIAISRNKIKNSQLDRDISAHQDELNSLRESRANMEGDRTRLKAQYEVLEEADKSFVGLNKGARKLLEASRDGNLSASFIPLNQVIEVAPKFEKAFSALLGEYIDALIMQNTINTEEALILLENEEGTRTFILPNRFEKNSTNKIGVNDPGILGKASDFVKIEDGFENLLSHFIGKSLIVLDRKTAMRIAEKLSNEDRIVTPQGEVFFGNGMILSAHTGQEALIARPRQKREIQDKIADIEEQINLLNAKDHQILHNLQNTRNEKKETEDGLRKLIKSEDELKRDHRQLHLQYETLEQSYQFHQDQYKDLNNSIGKIEDRESNYQGKADQN